MARRAPPKPETIERIRSSLSTYWADPEKRTQHGTLTRRRMARPGIGEKISQRTRTALARPEIRARHCAAMASPMVRQRVSERTRQAMSDQAVRQRIRDGMARAARLRAELDGFRALWRGLSDEARCIALREVAASQT